MSDGVGGLTSSLLLHAWLEAPTAHLAATSAALAAGSPAAPPEWSPWTNAWGWQVRPTAQRLRAIMTLSRSLVASRSASWAVPPPEGGSGVGMSVYAGGAAAVTRLGGGAAAGRIVREMGAALFARGGRDGGRCVKGFMLSYTGQADITYQRGRANRRARAGWVTV